MREELDFNGVILSDDLEMKAIADAYTVPDAAVQAIAAGCDGVLVCRANVSDRTGDAEAQVAVLEALVNPTTTELQTLITGGDVLALGHNAKERAAELARDLPVGIDMHLVADQPQVVHEAVGEFTESLVEAIAIVLALLSFLIFSVLFFARDWLDVD